MFCVKSGDQWVAINGKSGQSASSLVVVRDLVQTKIYFLVFIWILKFQFWIHINSQQFQVNTRAVGNGINGKWLIETWNKWNLIQKIIDMNLFLHNQLFGTFYNFVQKLCAQLLILFRIDSKKSNYSWVPKTVWKIKAPKNLP